MARCFLENPGWCSIKQVCYGSKVNNTLSSPEDWILRDIRIYLYLHCFSASILSDGLPLSVNLLDLLRSGFFLNILVDVQIMPITSFDTTVCTKIATCISLVPNRRIWLQKCQATNCFFLRYLNFNNKNGVQSLKHIWAVGMIVIHLLVAYNIMMKIYK